MAYILTQEGDRGGALGGRGAGIGNGWLAIRACGGGDMLDPIATEGIADHPLKWVWAAAHANPCEIARNAADNGRPTLAQQAQHDPQGTLNWILILITLIGIARSGL